MLAIVLSALFCAAALLAVTVIAHSIVRYGRQALQLQHELRGCPTHTTVRFETRMMLPVENAAHPVRRTGRPAMRFTPRRKTSLRAAA